MSCKSCVNIATQEVDSGTRDPRLIRMIRIRYMANGINCMEWQLCKIGAKWTIFNNYCENLVLFLRNRFKFSCVVRACLVSKVQTTLVCKLVSVSRANLDVMFARQNPAILTTISNPAILTIHIVVHLTDAVDIWNWPWSGKWTVNAIFYYSLHPFFAL